MFSLLAYELIKGRTDADDGTAAREEPKNHVDKARVKLGVIARMTCFVLGK